MNARNGKIARLPRQIREELNERLERSEPGPKLLAWLNALEEVGEVLRDEFDGAPVTKQNLSEWRQGGFQEWLARQDLQAAFQQTEDFAQDMDEDRVDVPADAVATVLAVRYGALLSRWDGEVDCKFEAQVQLLDRMSRTVVRLQRSTHQAKKEKEEYIRGLEEEDQKVKEMIKKKKLDLIWALRREPQVARAFGGGELGAKIAKYIVAVENDVPGAKLDLDGSEKPDPELVPPPRKERTAKRARNTAAKKARKPLEENEMEEETSVEQSSQVQPDQTSSEQPTEEGIRATFGLGMETER